MWIKSHLNNDNRGYQEINPFSNSPDYTLLGYMLTIKEVSDNFVFHNSVHRFIMEPWTR